MKRLGLLFATILLLLTPAIAVTIAGNLANITGNVSPSGANGGAFVRFRLQGYTGSQPKIIGSGVLAQTQFDCNATSVGCGVDSNGVLTGTIAGNDTISPAGTYYTVEIWFQGKQVSSSNYSIVGSSTWNINTAVPLIVPPPPVGNILYARTFDCLVAGVTSKSCAHNFGSTVIQVQCWDSNGFYFIPDSIQKTDPNTAILKFINPRSGDCTIINAGSVNLTLQPANAVVTNPNSDQNIVGFNFSHNGSIIPDVGHSFTWPGLQTFSGGIAVSQITSASANPALTGFMEMANTDQLCWKNFASSGNLCFSMLSSDFPQFNGHPFAFLDQANSWTQIQAFTNFTISSSTVIANLNASFLNGLTFAAPGTIGGTTPGAVFATNVTDGALTPSGCVQAGAAGLLTTPTSLPCQDQSIVVFGNASISGASITGGIATSIGSIALTMPASGGPFRVECRYSINTNLSGSVVNGWVTDGVNLFAGSQVANPVASGFSPVTYANNAAVTFTLRTEGVSGYTVNAAPISGGPNSNMQCVAYPSN